MFMTVLFLTAKTQWYFCSHVQKNFHLVNNAYKIKYHYICNLFLNIKRDKAKLANLLPKCLPIR